MGDPVRRWLRVQQDLGGNDVILDAPIALPHSVAARSIAAPAVRETAVTPAPSPITTVPPSVAGVRGSGTTPAPDWRKDAPPIPGSGMTVTAATSDEAARWTTLEEIAGLVAGCEHCLLCRTRTHAVPGEGNPKARLMVIGEGPGESEDRTGRPFVGRAGELLDRMLGAIGLPRGEVYIANVVKCRPPKNRVPLPEEREACMPYLTRQIALVQPKVLLALGGTAAEALLGVKASLGQLRTKVHQWNGIPLIVTYHPAALLRNPNWKRPAWDDVRIARQLLDRDA